jgi:2,4-dienoyl-CoA reductase (NADPH2)
VSYERIDDRGLHIRIASSDADADDAGEPRLLEVDTVVVCAGQESVRELYDELRGGSATEPNGPRGDVHLVDVHLVGGADVAAELDAKRAIEQGTRVAAGL